MNNLTTKQKLLIDVMFQDESFVARYYLHISAWGFNKKNSLNIDGRTIRSLRTRQIIQSIGYNNFGAIEYQLSPSVRRQLENE